MNPASNDLEKYKGVTEMLHPDMLAGLEREDALTVNFLQRGAFIRQLLDEGHEKIVSLMENPTVVNIKTRQEAFYESIKGLRILNDETMRTELGLLHLTPQGPDRNNYIRFPEAVSILERLEWATSEERTRQYQHYIQMLRSMGTPYWVKQRIVNPTKEGEAIVDRYRQFAGLSSLEEHRASVAKMLART